MHKTVTDRGVGVVIEEAKHHEASCEGEASEGKDVGESYLDSPLITSPL